MIGLIILVAFLIGWFGGVGAYKYSLKNSSVVLPPVNKFDGLRNMSRDIEISYKCRLAEYNRQVAELEKQRKDFYEKNPDFPYKTMYMQVIAPPQKISIIEIN